MNAILLAAGDQSLQETIDPEILDNTREVDYFLELAAFACNCPITGIRIGGKQKYRVKANKELHSLLQTGNLSFSCPDAQDAVVVIADTRKDQRFANDPLVTGKHRILFFAEAPVVSADGYKLGSLCVMHTSPVKNFTEQQKNALKTIAHLAACMVDMKINNKLAIQQADAQVQAEKKAARLAISEQDSEKGFITGKLQENFAQTLAATQLYLEYAEQSNDKKNLFIQKSRDSISTVINEIRYLCKSMAPAAMGHPDTIELIRDMVAEWETRHDIHIDFIYGPNLQQLKDHTWFMLFHIIQQQLKLSSHCQAKKVEISLLDQDGLTLYFCMKQANVPEGDAQKDLFTNSICSRVAMINGEIILDTSEPGSELMRINIPQAFKKS